jgi:transcriptional regulator with XRE-family HTH domain
LIPPTRKKRAKPRHTKGARSPSPLPVAVVRPTLGYRPMGAILLPSPAAERGGELSGRLGQEIRLLRKRQGMTIVELSQKSGQSTGFLSQIERGISIPSVSAIESIARALGVRVTWFFEAGEVSSSSEGDVVVRKGCHRRLTYANGITDQLLSPRLNGTIEMFLATFEPNSGNSDGWLTYSGDQQGFVLEGQLRLVLENDIYELSAGDSFGFAGMVRHQYSNPGSTKALVLWVFTRPTT